MSLPSPSDGRPIPPSESNNGPPHEPFLAAPSNTQYRPSREPSTSRGRALSSAGSRNASPRGTTPAAQAKPKTNGELERKPSQSYGHHRQTSIVHGVQHSRNVSLLKPANGSPLSPHKIMTSMGQDAGSEAIHSAPVGLRKSPSASALHNGAVSATTPRNTNRNLEGQPPERLRSFRVKNTAEHQRGPSVAQGHTELKTVGEYALHHLFTSFIAEADERIERCMPLPGEPDPRVEHVCGPGADPAFDQLISSLGHINRHKPKALIDAVIHWRKRKADAAHDLMNELETVRNSVQLTQSTLTDGFASISPAAEVDSLGLLEQDVGVADRRSRISIYILCRVLIEIIGQTTINALEGPDNTASRLEDIIYEQLKTADPDHITVSRLGHACWVVRAQLLGVMSGIRFEEVADKFIKDLEKAHKKLCVKGMVDPKVAARTSRLVYSMRWLKVRSCPDAAWQHSCDTLQTLAKFFAEVHGRVMKHAYAELFEQLLLPVAATATTGLNAPKWKAMLAVVQPKITQMLAKADHWPYVFPLQAVLLCVSPAEQFAREWLPLVVSSQPKAKDRSGRSHALKALCRLVWRYLYRLNDSQNAIAKKLDEVVKQVFQGGKRMLISTDPMIADPLIQLIRIIGYKQQDLCFRTIIFPLMNSELFSNPEQQHRIESLDPEKTVIAIRAFLAVMHDLERGEAPSFPTSFECDALLDPSSRSPTTHRRTRSQGFSVSAGRTERQSRPIALNKLNDVSREYYTSFCQILGQLTIICDNTFGGQAALDEKFTSHPPKTPMAEAFTFNRREDMPGPTDVRQQYYDLLHVAVEALPRCVSRDSPITSLVNLLCVGTAHVQSHIASSSTQSLRAIARQGYAQHVTMGFARFIFNFNDRYATVSDGSLLGPGHIEGTLTLYVELLQIWIDDIQRRAPKTTDEVASGGEKTTRNLDLNTLAVHIDDIESHGLFFLCSPSKAVRAIAVNVLHLVTKFDTAMGQPCTRIISILEGHAEAVINVDDERLAPAERGRLQKGSRKGAAGSILVELCSSDLEQDSALWFKIFPSLIDLSSRICVHTVALTRELVCQRLSNTHKTIAAISEGGRQGSVSQQDPVLLSARPAGRSLVTSPDVVVEQWKIHLIFACTTVTNIGTAYSNAPPKSGQSSQHTRKSSKSSSTSQEKIASAMELFSRVVPCLTSSNAAVRRAAVMGLGATNVNIYHALLEALFPFVATCNSEAKDRMGTHQRTVSSPRRSPRTDYLRVDITHLLGLTCHLLQDEETTKDTYALEYLVDYTKNLRIFLSDAEIQMDLTLIKLKTHFCTLLEGLYDYTRTLKDSSRWMSFQSRQASFALMEDWCVRSTDEAQIRRQDNYMRRTMMERDDGRLRGQAPSSFRKDIHELSNAALSAMASLCAGPLILVAQDSIVMQFDVRRLLAWIDYIFDQQSDRIHGIGRRALENLITHNPDHSFIMAQAIRRCYLAKTPKALASCFDVVTRVLVNDAAIQAPFWKTLCVGLYTLGNEDSAVRMKSARVLRKLEEQQLKTSKLQDLDISVSDKTTAVYKLAQFEISQRLAKQHAELAFWVFSEFSAYFNELGPDHQRNMVSAMLPWIQTIELQVDQNGLLTANTYMLLVNLFEITVRSSIHLHNEVQALWQALATGPYGGNVQLIIEFVKELCLDRKEANFVIYAKQIVVFVSKTPAGASVVDHLLQQITPKGTAPPRDGSGSIVLPPDAAALPYVADIGRILPSGGKQARLSCSTLSMILLVDLVVSPFSLTADRVQLLLGIVLCLWDFPTLIIQDQARELLVHLMHELIISKIDAKTTEPSKQSVEDFIESIRRNDPSVTWTLAECDNLASDSAERTVPGAMVTVVDQVINVFSIQYPTIRENLAEMAINWATNCPVRGVACGAFRIFRCTSITANAYTLAEIMLRLSNTVSGEYDNDYFTLEILTTLKAQIEKVTTLDLMEHPQFFWVTCACLDTVHEKEFQRALGMLDLLLDKIDLTGAKGSAVVELLLDKRTDLWQGDFNGLCDLVYKGVRSRQSMSRSLDVLERLIVLPSSSLVGGEARLLYTTLANLPRYLHTFDGHGIDVASLDSAAALASAAEKQHLVSLSRALRKFARNDHRNEKEFLASCISALRTSFFPAYEFPSLVFLLGMVNNQLDWMKIKTMQVLSTILADTDMRKPEIASQGPDLISPLLRLLQTEHCQQALDVLDNVIDMTGTPLDSKHLRMSMAGSHSSRATRKVYESTKSLYGIPEESGWSIPMPADYSRQTRHNTLETANTLVANADTPGVEFVQDEQDSYFGESSVVLTPDERPPDGNMDELAQKLDSLDDFFDEQTDLTSSPNMTRYPSGLVEERENLYDEQALPILHRSLQRNASVTSFQTGFAELRYPYGRDPMVMNPGAFASNPTAAIRPGMHNRSITTPTEVMTVKRMPPHSYNDIASGDEAGDEPEPFSDDELISIGRAHTTEETQFAQSGTKPAGFKAGFRSGLRRLASTSGSRDPSRAAQAKSPKVPKVPQQYLRE